ncbi:Low-density lipoprotein receptor domain class A [compost metagenome]
MEDCGDGRGKDSDERSCAPFFRCDNGTNLVASEVCDGADACGDGSDEDLCL